MKILIVGLGSIGRRHAALLKNAGVDIAILRSAQGTLKEKSEYLEFYSLEEAMNYQPDGVIIANPTALHVGSALPFLQQGIHTLVEKPVAESVAAALQLEPFAEKLRVAYCMRFLPLVEVIKEIAAKENVFKVSFRRSYYLPKWHPYADYRLEYTAQKQLGGGVIRTLSHEIDLMLYLFGEPVSVTGVTDKLSPLEIDTDDFASLSCKMSNGARINFDLDFFSPANINVAELFTEKGKYTWDISAMYFTPYDATVPVQIHGAQLFGINEMYQNQTNDFINFIKNGESRNADLATAVNVLKIIESIDG